MLRESPSRCGAISHAATEAAAPRAPAAAARHGVRPGMLIEVLVAAVAVLLPAQLAYIAMSEGRRRSARTLWFFFRLSLSYRWDNFKCRAAGASQDEKERREHALHEAFAPQALELILHLGGLYVKWAQTICGTGQLPIQYERRFDVLLDRVPGKPFDVIRNIVEEELGGPMGAMFRSFEEDPIGVRRWHSN